jgi:hypothetical protein
MMNVKELNQEMWKRLTSDPELLALDSRVDEQPEDIFIRLSQSGNRDTVVSALRELLACHVLRDPSSELAAEVRFLSRAIRLCDALSAEECKEALKLLLLEEDSARWNSHLDGLQELAARALLSLPKDKKDFRFWKEIAFMQRPTCPYALNALLQIDLVGGIKCVDQVYRTTPKRLRSRLADWDTILLIAKESYGEKQFAKAAAAFLNQNSEHRNKADLLDILAKIAGIHANSIRSPLTHVFITAHHGKSRFGSIYVPVSRGQPAFKEEPIGHRLGNVLEYRRSDPIPVMFVSSKGRLAFLRGLTGGEEYAAQLLGASR